MENNTLRKAVERERVRTTSIRLSEIRRGTDKASCATCWGALLDLGCGRPLTNQIAAVGAEVIGIDKSTTMIEEARRLYELGVSSLRRTDFHFDQPLDAVFLKCRDHWDEDQASVARCIWEALSRAAALLRVRRQRKHPRRFGSALTDAVRAAGEEVVRTFCSLLSTMASTQRCSSSGFRVVRITFRSQLNFDGGEQGLRNWLFTSPTTS